MPAGRHNNGKKRPDQKVERRLLKRQRHVDARKEGARGGTRGSPAKASERPQAAREAEKEGFEPSMEVSTPITP